MHINKTILKLLSKHKWSQIIIYTQKSTIWYFYFSIFFVFEVTLNRWGIKHYEKINTKKKKSADLNFDFFVSIGKVVYLESRNWVRTFWCSKFRDLCLVSEALRNMRRFIQHVENDGFIDPTQRKKVGFEPNLAQMLYITSSMKRNYCGAYCCLYTSYSNIKNLKSTPIPLLGIKHEKTHKKNKNLPI
jgi:hypothetical protein